MDLSALKRMSFKHKNNKILFYFLGYIRLYAPKTFCQRRLKRELAKIKDFDASYILQRVNYYNRLDSHKTIYKELDNLSTFKLRKKHKTYFFDSYQYVRFFNFKHNIQFLFGDVVDVPTKPSIVKSRPVGKDNANSVLLKLDKIRHFLFLKDPNAFVHKKNQMVGRAKIAQPHRVRFMELYFGHPLCNIGQVRRDSYQQWKVPRMTISEHLKYKFILCLEGYDVASNLKWVMSSNSLAVMTKPKFETWFMEETLIPNYHYVLIKDDFSDLEERLNHYIDHPDEALQIIENAHRYIEPFKNKKMEKLISLMVVEKYLVQTGQNPHI